MNNEDREKILKKHGLYVMTKKTFDGGHRAVIWRGGRRIAGVRINGSRYQAIRQVFERYKNAVWTTCQITEANEQQG